jgi:CheY-like chemotaxis protein
LAIVRHLVEMHGGTVAVESAGINQGTTFIVTMPIKAAFDNEASATDVFTLANENRSISFAYDLDGVRVLVVDDDTDARLLLTTIIEKSGASVRTAGSVSEALEILKDFQPHILVSDIGMPDEDGYSLIRKVRALYPEAAAKISAVALTAYARAEDRILALEAGFQIHIAKPVNPEELLSTLKELSAAER